MFNDIEWTKRGNSENAFQNPEKIKNYAKRFSRGHWSFRGPSDEENWYGNLNYYALEGKWDAIATKTVGHFKETGHPVFKGISALSRGILKRKTEIPYTSMRMLRTQNSFFAHFTQQISSVSTKQYQAGVKKSLNGFRIKKELTLEKSVAKENEQLLKNVMP